MVMDAKATSMDVSVDDAVEETVVDTHSQEEPKPSTEPETLTREEAEKLANEKHSRLDKRIAALEKASQLAERQRDAADAKRKAAELRAAEFERRAEEAERERLKGSPEGLEIYEERIKNRRKEKELSDREDATKESEARHAEELAEAKTYKVRKQADEIASEYGVDASLLVELTDGSREKMEKLAKSLPNKENGDNQPNLQKPPKPGTLKRSSRFGNLTTAQLNDLAEKNPDAYYQYVEERNKSKDRR